MTAAMQLKALKKTNAAQSYPGAPENKRGNWGKNSKTTETVQSITSLQGQWRAGTALHGYSSEQGPPKMTAVSKEQKQPVLQGSSEALAGVKRRLAHLGFKRPRLFADLEEFEPNMLVSVTKE